jgi:tryptophan halogenase
MQKILIVGGGSAGWMAAAYLNGALNLRGKRPRVAITLVESPDIPRISVGEATIPSMRHLLSVVGIKEDDFMRAADATFKQSIKYQNWVRKDGSFYHHPFTLVKEQPLDRAGELWLSSDQSMPFMDTCTLQAPICEANKAPISAGLGGAQGSLNYAYHMNAQKFADTLRDFSTARGVEHVYANFEGVDLDDQGWIQSVRTDTAGTISADMFVDCTGFTGLLISKTLNVGFEDYAQFLLCNRAVTMHLPYERFYPGTIRPYTTATALSSGWVWDIPMQNQRSIGYVHSSDFISKEEAEEELRSYQGPGTEDLPVRFVDFKVGRRKQLWVNNCVAIGLAGGFIEPLESTGLYLSDLGAVLLAEHWPRDRSSVHELSSRYNRLMANRYYEILDFINMHYCLTKRTDTPFWREVQKPERINPRLAAKLAMWRHKLPSSHDFEDQWFNGMASTEQLFDWEAIGGRGPVDTGGLWDHKSYECILHGMHFFDEYADQWFGAERPITQRLPQVERGLSQAANLPDHAHWLQTSLGASTYHTGDKPAGWGSA